MRKSGFRGFTAVPLLANGQSLGVLSVIDTRLRRFTEDEVSLLAAFADQAEGMRPFSHIDIRLTYLKISNKMPSVGLVR